MGRWWAVNYLSGRLLWQQTLRSLHCLPQATTWVKCCWISRRDCCERSTHSLRLSRTRFYFMRSNTHTQWNERTRHSGLGMKNCLCELRYELNASQESEIISRTNYVTGTQSQPANATLLSRDWTCLRFESGNRSIWWSNTTRSTVTVPIGCVLTLITEYKLLFVTVCSMEHKRRREHKLIPDTELLLSHEIVHSPSHMHTHIVRTRIGLALTCILHPITQPIIGFHGNSSARRLHKLSEL